MHNFVIGCFMVGMPFCSHENTLLEKYTIQVLKICIFSTNSWNNYKYNVLSSVRSEIVI